MTQVETRPRLAELHVADPPERWHALGFTVTDDRVELGGVTIRTNAQGEGITRWGLTAIDPRTTNVDGLTTTSIPTPPQQKTIPHPNTATGLDHLVIVTPDFGRTREALERVGIPLSRIRTVGDASDPGSFRQGFRRLGPAILELVEVKQLGPSAGAGAQPGPAGFWGLVIIVQDLPALAERLGDRLKGIKPAVQPGRQIATLSKAAGLSPAVAFMDRGPAADRDPAPDQLHG